MGGVSGFLISVFSVVLVGCTTIVTDRTRGVAVYHALASKSTGLVMTPEGAQLASNDTDVAAAQSARQWADRLFGEVSRREAERQRWGPARVGFIPSLCVSASLREK